MAELLFYLLSLAAVGFSVGVVAARSPLFSVLSLLGAFVSLAVIYLLCGFQFLAAAQLLVYAGAIMVLFLFVLMLLNLGDPETTAESPGAFLGKKRLGIAAGAAALLAFVGIAATASGVGVVPALVPGGIDDVQALAVVLFSRYLLPFEAASILLLATIVAVIVLAKRERAPSSFRGLGLGENAPPPPSGGDHAPDPRRADLPTAADAPQVPAPREREREPAPLAHADSAHADSAHGGRP